MINWNDDNQKDFSDFYTLEFRKGGKLIENHWVKPQDWDEAKGEYAISGYYEERELDIMAMIHKRDRQVKFDGATLNDIFKFISNDGKEICDIMFPNCFVAELTRAWSKIDQASIPTTVEYDPGEIEYLEAYWCLTSMKRECLRLTDYRFLTSMASVLN